ncbi:hypothetical protein [Paenibacillus lautus]|uniref:hypothetical protein n=1 Tax=Paenibacillus lautus TaxID=1401 RepID=UPI00398841FE
MTPNTVTAQTYWVWTELAQEKNPKHARAGDPIWPHYKYEAPIDWLEKGLICDSSKIVKEGQADLFEYI